MAIIKSFASYQNLSNFGTFINDQSRTSEYFRITEFKDTFTGGKNGFLIEGSEHLKETTEIKIEILDVTGTPIYYEPGNGIPEYYEGISKIVSVHVYEDTPIGLGKITILGELKTYIDEAGVVRDIPAEWSGIYNIKWERTFNVNKNLSNETIVRFYKRPKITIDEINKPIFNITTPSVTQTGLVEGIPQQPVYGTDIRTWTAGTLYKLKITDGTNWTSSVDENTITIPSLGYSATVREVLNNKEVFVDIPYTISSSISNFPPTAYTTTFDHIEGQTIINSALTGSFAKIQLSDLKTFVGDVARVKVYRKSRNEVGDYQFIQDTKLESSEILKDITTTANTELSYGQFTDTNIKNYWVSGSSTHPITINVDKLNASVKVDYSGTNYDNPARLITSQSLSLAEGVEYTLSFKTLLSGSVDPTKTLKAYFSGSDYPQQTIVNITNSAIYTTKQNVTQNVKATKTGDAKLVFEFAGDDWYLANVSLQNAQETSFSPDEFTLIQDIPRKLASETYDFKFEFYDINNNYIPVDVKTSKTFNGGNSFTTTSKILTFESDRTAFRFTSGSFGNPAFQQVGFSISRTNLTGSVTYASAAFDTNGNYIVPASYAGTYPGALTNAGDGGASLTIANFSGSVPSVLIGSITYTASCDGLNEFETIYRFEDGENAPGLFTTSNANQFIYKATDLSLNPTGQVITIEAKRKNLASTTGTLEVNSGSLKPPLTIGATDATSGVTLFTLAGSAYPFLSGSTTYSFTGSDQFGNKFSDAVTITPVKILDGLSVTLTNDNTSLPALSTGVVANGDFVFTSGSVNVKVGNETITFDDDNDNLRANNTFAITNLSGIGCTPNITNPSTNVYGITALAADSGSLDITINYKDGAGDTTSVIKTATYTKNKKAAPVLAISATPKDQSVTAKSTGAQIDNFANVTIVVKETYNGSTTTKALTALTATSTDIASISSPFATGIVALNGKTLAAGTNSTTVAISAVVNDSEGTSRTLTDTLSLSKVKKAAPVVVATLSKDGQSITKTNTGVYGTPATFTISVNEGGSDYTYSTGGAVNTYQISIGVGQGTGTTTITPTTPTTDAGTTVAITITYVNSEGTTGTITKEHKVNVTINGTNGTNGTDGDDGANGQTGPGVVHTGVWTSGRTYQFSNGLSDATGRRDTVLWSSDGNAPYNTYYATTRQHLSAVGNVINGAPHQAAQTGWISLGAQDFFVAAKIGIFEDSFVQKTLNIGTNSNGAMAAANITLAGGSAYPYISIGQSSSAGSQGYNVNGIFMGVVNVSSSPVYRLSLKSASNSLLWDGTSLTVNGGGTFSGALSAATGTFNGSIRIGSGESVFTADTSGIYLGNETFGSAEFSVTPAGVLKATSGTIGGWTLGATTLTGGAAILDSTGAISIGTTNNVFKADSNGMWLGNATFGNAPFRVTNAGILFATGADITGRVSATTGNIGGWTVTPTSIRDSTEKLRLNASRPAIEIYEGTALRVDISNASTLSSLSAGSVTISPTSVTNWNTQQEYASNTSQYVTQISANMDPTYLEWTPGSSPSFTTSAGTTGIYSISTNLWHGVLSNYSVYLEPGNQPFGGNAPYINYVQHYYTIGISVRAGGTGIANEVLDISKAINFSQVFGYGNTTIEEQFGWASGDAFGTLTGAISLSPSTAYYFVPYIKNGVCVAYRDSGTVSTFDVSVSYNTPKISTISVSQQVSKTELVAGGFQVVASTDRYLKVERNEANTNFVAVGGGITATGNITAFATSDKRLKENIIPIGKALDKIEKLDGVEFDWTDEYIQKESGGKGEDNYFIRKHDVGLIAQQVETILPEVVVKRVDGYLAIKYEKIVPLLVECIKELKKEINELKENK
jgi:hypothetical protein